MADHILPLKVLRIDGLILKMTSVIFCLLIYLNLPKPIEDLLKDQIIKNA